MNHADRERYRSVFRSSPSAYSLLDPDLRVVDFNTALCRLTGRDPDLMIGLDLLEAFPSDPDAVGGVDPAEAVRQSLLRVRGTGAVDALTELRYDIVIDGSYTTKYWNIVNTPVFDDSGVLVGLLNRSDDVTSAVLARIALEKERARSDRLQAQVADAQDALLARAAELQRLNERLQVANEHDRSVAEALQSAMLTDLPQPDDLQLSARYRTATGTDQVGGDWYDAIVSSTGATTLMIGDVAGHDIGAAGYMGQLRRMLRAFAWDYQNPPSHMVELLDRAMHDLHLTTSATLTVVTIEMDDPTATGRTLRWTNAGHPCPVLLFEDGSTEVLSGHRADPLLGVVPNVQRTDHARSAPDGSMLLLYTDGLIETRHDDLDTRLGELRDSLTRHRDLPVGLLLDTVITDMVGEHPDDDVAVLAVRFRPNIHPDQLGTDGTGPL